MKFDRYTCIGVGMCALYLLIPILIGHIPSFPKKSGVGWTPEISMTRESGKFWDYEKSMLWQVAIILLLACLARKNFAYAKRRPIKTARDNERHVT